MNKIEELFGLLQSDISHTVDTNEPMVISDMGVNYYGTNELIEMGFVSRNINQLLSKVSNDDIVEYFNMYVKNSTVSDIGNLDVTDSTGIATISQFIFAIQKSSVYGYLNKMLSEYLMIIKGDKDGDNVN